MRCAHEGCLASVMWFGHPDDPAIAVLARQSGWRVFEGKGWLCKRHQPQAIRALADPLLDRQGKEGV